MFRIRNSTFAIVLLSLMATQTSAQAPGAASGPADGKSAGRGLDRPWQAWPPRIPSQSNRLAELLARSIDQNHDQELSIEEIASASESLRKLDRDGDGKISLSDLPRSESRSDGPVPGWPRGPGHGGPHSGGGVHGAPFPGGPHPEPARSEPYDGRPISTGFLFLNGVYIPPPYFIRRENQPGEDARVEINQQEIPTGSRPRYHPAGPGQSAVWGMDALAQKLKENRILVAFTDRPLVCLENGGEYLDLYKILTAHPDRDVALKSLLATVPADSRDRWLSWLNESVASADLLARLKTRSDSIETMLDETADKMAATRRMTAWSYPLSIFGMALVVLSAGHILSFRPPTDASSATTPQAAIGTIFNVLLILGLSSMDLVWTLMASQAGVMHELNPLGSQLVQNPWMLILFKLTASAIAGSVLVGLRRRRFAQMASWWLCLVCVLVTCRWLVFNSMFVT